jgi:hypothetical protein
MGRLPDSVQAISPLTGREANHSMSISIERRQDEDGNTKDYLVGKQGSHEILRDVTDQVRDIIEGSTFRAMTGLYMSRLNEYYYGTNSPADLDTLDIEDITSSGLNAAVGDLCFISRSEESAQLTNGDFFFVRAITASSPASSEGTIVAEERDVIGSPSLNSPFSQEYPKGSLVFNLKDFRTRIGTSRGANKAPGIHAFLQAPPATTFSAASSTSPVGVSVTITANSSVIVPVAYSIYVRKSPIYRIEPHWVADWVGTDVTSSIVVQTYEGGADAGGGALVATDEVYVVAVTHEDRAGAILGAADALAFSDFGTPAQQSLVV